MNFSAWIQAVLRGWMEFSRNSWLSHMLMFLNACNIGRRANKSATSAISIGLLIESWVKRNCLWIRYCLLWVSQVVLVVKNSPDNVGDIRDAGSIPGLGRSPREGRATHSSILAKRIPRREEPGKLQSIALQRVEYDWSDLAWSLYSVSD